MLVHRSRRVAQSGLTNLLHPEIRVKAEIVLTQPYDPNKIPILLVHGLQSTPVAFLQLVTALESDPQIARRFQFWHFYYSTGTPVLLNALRLRDELERTVHLVDPDNDDPATHRIVVVGHSMGGLLAHTLVSSSGDRLWKSLFLVPPGATAGRRGDDPAVATHVVLPTESESCARHLRRDSASRQRDGRFVDRWPGQIAD